MREIVGRRGLHGSVAQTRRPGEREFQPQENIINNLAFRQNHFALYTFHFDHVTQRDTTQHATTPREYHVAHTPNVNVSGNFTPEWRCAEAIRL